MSETVDVNGSDTVQEDVRVPTPKQAAEKALADRERERHGLEVGDYLVASRNLDRAIKNLVTFAAHTSEMSEIVQYIVGSQVTAAVDKAVGLLYTAVGQVKFGRAKDHTEEIQTFVNLQNESRAEWEALDRRFTPADNDIGPSPEAVADAVESGSGVIITP